MDHQRSPAATVEAYIAPFPPEVRELLEQLRETIRAAAPEAEERISYQIPTFAWHGNLVHFAAHRKHIGFYPGAAAIEAFETELSRYDCSKGTVRFPVDRPLPLDLIRAITMYRVAENRTRAEARGRKTR